MESPRTLDGRIVLGVVALVCVVAFLWVASAVAGGSTTEPSGTTPAAEYVQDENGRDCPERGDGAGSVPAGD